MADEVGARVPKHRFGLRIGLDDLAGLTDDDHGIKRGFEQSIEFVFRPLARGDVAEGVLLHPHEFAARSSRDTLTAHPGNYDPLEDKRLC
ncbi:MAG: hypothetical protein ABI847_12610 [Anaerolineales bacterium]